MTDTRAQRGEVSYPPITYGVADVGRPPWMTTTEEDGAPGESDASAGSQAGAERKRGSSRRRSYPKIPELYLG